MTQGDCPLYIPLQTTVTTQDATCDGNQSCDGNISITTKFGVPPYDYSINNGLTWQNSNFFFNLCPNTYTVITRDSANNTNNNIVTIGYSQNPTTYQVSINLLSNLTETINVSNSASKTTYFTVTSNPPIPVGTTLSFNLDFSSIKTTNGPGSGTTIDNISVYKNGNLLSNINSSVIDTTTNTRPNCSPEIQTIVTESESYYCEMTSNDIITGSTQSVLNITDGQISDNSCVTELTQIIYLGIVNTNLNGCYCCTSVADTNLFPVVDNSISYTDEPTPQCVTCEGVINAGTGIFINANQIVGGLICTGPNKTGCFQNFRYCNTPSPNCMITDNGVVSTYVCGILPNPNVQYMVALFQVPTDGFYNITADAYLNNVKVGTGQVNEFIYESSPSTAIEVNMFSPINLQIGSVFRVVYYQTP
jgi:hypothetical protein